MCFWSSLGPCDNHLKQNFNRYNQRCPQYSSQNFYCCTPTERTKIHSVFHKRSDLSPVVWGPSRTHGMKYVRTGSQEEPRIVSQPGCLPAPLSRPYYQWPAWECNILMTDAQLQGLWFCTTPSPHCKPRHLARQAANNFLDILPSKITECPMTDKRGFWRDC